MRFTLFILVVVITQIEACMYASQYYDCGSRNAQGQYCNWMTIGAGCGPTGGNKCCEDLWCSDLVDCSCNSYVSMCHSSKIAPVNLSYI